MEKEIVELKSRKMTQKIDELKDIYNLLFEDQDSEECMLPELIKKQYLEMYNKIIESGEYEKYKELEDIIIKGIAKVELKIDRHINSTKGNYNEIFKKNLEKIYKSNNYLEAADVDSEIRKIKQVKKLFSLYSPYMSNNDFIKIKESIIRLKFDLLYRKQIEDLIYKNESNTSYLKGYANNEEKEFFKRVLQEKIYALKIIRNIKNDNQKDDIFKINVEKVINDHTLIEKLIIIDMKKNPYDYIDLVKAKVFNAHLCNIGNNPFKKEIYITNKELEELGLYKYTKYRDERLNSVSNIIEEDYGFKADKVNYSILEALITNIITDENISYIDCEKLYRRFGFECNPIIIQNRGQEYIKMIVDEVKDSKKYKKIVNDCSIKKEKNEEKQYCIINFEGLNYEFQNDIENIENELEENKSNSKTKFRLLKKKKSKEDILKEKIERIKTKGDITKDIDIIIMLANEIIEKNNKNNTEKDIKWLEDIKNKKGVLKLEETRKLTLVIENIYNELNIRHDSRRILSLEDMGSVIMGSGDRTKIMRKYKYGHNFAFEQQVCYVELPTYNETINLLDLWRIMSRDLRPLWKKYKKEFKELGIDVKKYDVYNGGPPRFKICVNLNDIQDLPIDYKKVKLLTKEELKEIIEREEWSER